MCVACRLCQAQQFEDGLHLVNNAMATVSDIMHQLGMPQDNGYEHAPLVLLRGRLHARKGEVHSCSRFSLVQEVTTL